MPSDAFADVGQGRHIAIVLDGFLPARQLGGTLTEATLRDVFVAAEAMQFTGGRGETRAFMAA